MSTKIIELCNILDKDQSLVELFRFNLMTKDIEFTRESSWGGNCVLNDRDLIHLKHYIAYTRDKEFNKNIIDEAVLINAMNKKYHPLKDYLNRLEWDRKERVDTWLIDVCGADDNEYVRDVSKIFLCAAIKRVFIPGCKFDYMPILEGGQGIGKSTMIDILGGEWYLDTHLSGSEDKKDIVDAMRTAWIIEIGDMAGFRKSDVEYLKTFISDKSDRVRLPYAKRSEDFPRQCVFIGTHNPSGDNDYFKDDTGNRRFWPIECKNINLDLLKENRNQLFAEAMFKYKEQDLFIKNKKSLEILDSMHKSRQIETPLNGMIDDYIKVLNFVKNKEIIEKVFQLQVGKLTFNELRNKCIIIGIHMKKIGWIRGQNEKRGIYFRPGYEHEQIENKIVDWEEAIE